MNRWEEEMLRNQQGRTRSEVTLTPWRRNPGSIEDRAIPYIDRIAGITDLPTLAAKVENAFDMLVTRINAALDRISREVSIIAERFGAFSTSETIRPLEYVLRQDPKTDEIIASDRLQFGGTENVPLFKVRGGTAPVVAIESDAQRWDFEVTTGDKLEIKDSTAGVTCVAITAGAPANSLAIGSNGNLVSGAATANAAAIMDLTSTTKGFLIPRMTTTQRNNISSPPAGLVVYNTSTNKWNFYNGTAWAEMGSGAGGEMPPVVFRAQNNEPPTANYATLDTRNVHPCLDFDDAIAETAVFSGVLPDSYGGGGLTVDLYHAATSATSGNVQFDVYIERLNAGGPDLDADSFATENSTGADATSTTSGILTKSTATFTDGADMDSLAAGEPFRIKITLNLTGSTVVGDVELYFVKITET